MISDKMKKSIFQAALLGKLTEQKNEDGDARELLIKIKQEKDKLLKNEEIRNQFINGKSEDVPYEIPENWCWTEIGEIFTLQAGKFISSDKIKSEGKYKCFGGNGLRGYVDSFNRSGKYPLIGRQGALCGNINFACGDFYATEHAVVVQTHANCSPEWAAFFLEAVNLNQYATATAQPGLAVNKINKVLLPLPPLQEQVRIVESINKLLVEIEMLKADEKKLKSLQAKFPLNIKNSILMHAIQGKLTEQHPDDDAGELMDNILLKKNELIKKSVVKKQILSIEISDEEKPFEIPESWRWIRFADLVDYQMGKTPPRQETEFWSNDIPWVSIADMCDGGVIENTKEGVSITAQEMVFRNQIVSRGTLLMSFKLSIGKVSILGIDALHNEAIISIYPFLHSDTIKPYLLKILPIVSQWGNSKDAIKGKTLNSDSLNNLIIPLPPLKEQIKIVERLEQILPLCKGLELL